ncbi:hypothetical protein B0O99DRAFT_694411 [Bisporella sp. PMI_857]|nr:hypothetical protein B0O99DRAFT_694411 [Bisporella sp. PMI_857]
MKVILMGSSGFVKNEVINQCLDNPSLTSVIVASHQSSLPDSVSNSKLKFVTIDGSITVYPDELLKEIRDAEACIWLDGDLGGSHVRRKVHTSAKQYNISTAIDFVANVIPLIRSRSKFKFVICDGNRTRNQESKVWFTHDVGKFEGNAENRIIQLADQYRDVLQVTVVKPGFILRRYLCLPDWIAPFTMSVKVDHLAAVMVDIAVKPSVGDKTQIVKNGPLTARGQALLRVYKVVDIDIAISSCRRVL